VQSSQTPRKPDAFRGPSDPPCGGGSGTRLLVNPRRFQDHVRNPQHELAHLEYTDRRHQRSTRAGYVFTRPILLTSTNSETTVPGESA
jgi:hypothetical protein